MNIQHSSRTDCWYTPLWLILKIKKVLGEITLDPASDPHGNARIGASHFIAEDSLSKEWSGTILLNPPGGKTGNRSNVQLFWSKLMQTLASGRLEHAIFLGFSIECVQTTQRHGELSVCDFPLCVPSKRVQFDPHPSRIKPAVAPSHSNVVVYVPGSVNHTDRFASTFQNIGAVLNVR